MSALHMPRDLFDDEHEAFREVVRSFMEKECAPNAEQWTHDGQVPRELWTKAGDVGLLGTDMPTEYGGGGVADYRYNVVLTEETARIGADGPGFLVHNDVVGPYLRLGTPEQKQRYIPGFCSGELITGIAMTEPGAGSDLQGVATTAVSQGDGSWILNGSKTFISNGIMSGLVVVFARTNPEAGSRGFSLFLVEDGMEGFERGRNLDKIGMKAQDTAELFFDDVHLPADHLLGEEGHGFLYLMNNLPQERLAIAVVAAAAIERMLGLTLDYTAERRAFGQSISKFQHVRFELAEMSTEAEVCRTYIDRCIELHNRGELDAVAAAKAKWWSTELQVRVAHRCLQLFGGYGYMAEYPISKDYLNSRGQTIYGGTTEIMKEIIGQAIA